MIVVDASAIAAILGRESDGEALSQRLERLPRGLGLRAASTVTLWEAASAVARIHRVTRDRAFELVMGFCTLTEIAPVAALLFKGDDFGRTDIQAA